MAFSALMREMSVRGLGKLLGLTILGTLTCMSVAVSINYALFRPFGDEAMQRALVSGTLIPTLLAAPLFFHMALKLRELAMANRQLENAAAVDFLTRCLNRGSFSARVENWLANGAEERRGALLVVDADHFKRINDRFGHYEGDVALKAIAEAIRATVRSGDLVGRLGGEEFGVFLPDATKRGAAIVAERIRQTVNSVAFRPGGKSCSLSVSVGCAAFDRRIGFTELFRVADDRLYEAKSNGRNRVVLASVETDGAELVSLH